MNNFWTMVKFEHKKILTPRFYITFAVLIIFISISSVGILIGNVYTDGEVSGTRYDDHFQAVEYELALSGKEINLELLKEARDAYALYDETASLEEQRRVAEEHVEQYFVISAFFRSYYGIYDWVDMGKLSDEALADFEEIKLNAIQDNINQSYINDNSKELLLSLSEQIDTPTVYQYGGGYTTSETMLCSNALLFAIVISIFLSGIFAKDYSTNVISLQHTSKNGKTTLFKAKVFTVFSITAISLIICIATTLAICLSVYGTEGMNSAYQNYNRISPYPITVFQSLLINIGIIFVATILFSFIVALISSFVKSSLVALSISILLIIIPQFISIPLSMPNLYRLFCLYPTSAYVNYRMISNILYEIGSVSILPFVFVPIVHILTIIVLIFISCKIYKNHQVR